MRILFALAVLCFSVWMFASSAFAGTPVDLKANPMAHGAIITLSDLFEGTASQVRIGRSAPVGGEAVLDAGKVQAVAAEAGLDWDNPTGQRRITVGSLGGEAEAGKALSPIRRMAAARRTAVLTYARNIQPGEILRATDLVLSNDVAFTPDGIADADLAIGKAARRALHIGGAVSTRDLAAARAIKRDELIEVVFEEDGVTLTQSGKALSDGAVGDEINIQNVDSKRTIQAVVLGPGRAGIGAPANAIRSEPLHGGRTTLAAAYR